jgi:IclR family acetate operon transcriptional repressor
VTATSSLKPPRIQALARASAIIDVIAIGDEAGVGLSVISKATGLNKTTAFNLLASLVTLRFVEQDAHSRKYRLGLRLLELGRLVQQRLHISQLARPALTSLCKSTNETVNLGLPDLLDLSVIDSYVGSRVLHASGAPGWRYPYHCTALGKALMAGSDEPMRQTIYGCCGLPGHTVNTITDTAQLEEQLAQCREQGYVLDRQEYEIGVNGIATWIVDGLGNVAAAISVVGHSGRLTEKAMQRIAPDVIEAADAIAAALGGTGSTGQAVAAGRR